MGKEFRIALLYQMKFLLILITGVCCSSCAWMTGSDLRENVVVHVPPNTTVKDVYSGERVPLNTLYTSDSSVAPSICNAIGGVQ
jgi:hypothetical protein